MNPHRPIHLWVLAMAAGLAWTSSLVYGQDVVINEFMALNTHTLSDESSEYDDWIELYNPTTNALDVGGFYLTHALSDKALWRASSGPGGSPGQAD